MESYYKVSQVFKSSTGIRKCDRKLLQSATSITKYDNYYKVRRKTIFLCSAKYVSEIKLMSVWSVIKYLAHALAQFPFTTIKTELDCYYQKRRTDCCQITLVY